MLSVKLQLATAKVDYTAAFLQAKVEGNVYVEMSRGFREPGKVLKLKQNLYGLCQSPRNFFENLKAQLMSPAVGFRQSECNPYLFIKDDCICVTYVDDCLLFYQEF